MSNSCAAGGASDGMWPAGLHVHVATFHAVHSHRTAACDRAAGLHTLLPTSWTVYGNVLGVPVLVAALFGGMCVKDTHCQRWDCSCAPGAQVTRSHRLDDSAAERERVLGVGAEVAQSEVDGKPVGPLRVWPGGLAMSRTLGDHEAGATCTCEPDVRQACVTLTSRAVPKVAVIAQLCHMRKLAACRSAARFCMTAVDPTMRVGSLTIRSGCGLDLCLRNTSSTDPGFSRPQLPHEAKARPHGAQVTLPHTGARILLASDGLWDAVNPKTAAHHVRKLAATKAAKELVGPEP